MLSVCMRLIIALKYQLLPVYCICRIKFSQKGSGQEHLGHCSLNKLTTIKVSVAMYFILA